MSVIDIDALLQEISPENPCGEDSEYDTVFVDMEAAAQGTPERQSGDTIVPAEGPDWQEVRNKASILLARTKDLRVAVYLSRALLHTSGLVGLNDGLALLRGLLARYWETIHPRLDPDDDYDPTIRVNTILAVCDTETTLRSIRETPLVNSSTLGRFTIRDMDIASGKLTVSRGKDEPPPPKMAEIDAAFMACAAEDLQATTTAVSASIEHVNTIEALVTDYVGAAQAPSLGPLVKLLQEIYQILAERLARRGITDTAMGTTTNVAVDNANQPGETEATVTDNVSVMTRAPQSITGEINSREDVIRMLDKMCDYFSRNEPSSPVPLLLKRARRLVSMDFMEIIRELAPDSVAKVETLGGSGGSATSSEKPAK